MHVFGVLSLDTMQVKGLLRAERAIPSWEEVSPHLEVMDTVWIALWRGVKVKIRWRFGLMFPVS
jgi:hypothetical protein